MAQLDVHVVESMGIGSARVRGAWDRVLANVAAPGGWRTVAATPGSDGAVPVAQVFCDVLPRRAAGALL